MQSKYIVDTHTYEVGKDIDGNKHTIKEIQKVILDIVLEFDRVCRKNNVPYALAFGSALGAVNYGGFIPWDDDIDIAVMYEDVPRLIAALKKDLSPDYYFHCFETNNKYYPITPTMKVRKRNTYIKETNSAHLPNKCDGDGLFVDICALMGVPSDPKEHKKVLKYAKRRMPWFILLNSYLHLNTKGMKKRLKRYEARMAEKYKDSGYIGQTVIIPFQDWTNDHSVDKISYPKDVILPFKECEFEVHKLFTFQDPETFARMFYGDDALKRWDGNRWTTDYPEKRRISKHIKKYSLSREK